VQSAHWSALALWYVSVLFALVSIFTGAQQALVLYGMTPDARGDHSEVEDSTTDSIRRRFQASRDENLPSLRMLFVWQVPIMFLGYSVLTFLTGYCSVIFSPLTEQTGWNADAKVSYLSGANL
jgi:hypothetical protein